MSAATMAYGMRARERMPFVWDYLTLGLTAALLLIGLIMVTSASMSIAAKDLGNPFYFLERQLAFGAVGVALAAGVHHPLDVEREVLDLDHLGAVLAVLLGHGVAHRLRRRGARRARAPSIGRASRNS